MARYLGPADLQRLFDEGLVRPHDCIGALARAHAEHGRARVDLLPRQVLWADPVRHEPDAPALHVGAAYLQDGHVMGASVDAVRFPPGAAGPWVTVFDGDTGKVVGVVHGRSVDVWRAAAAAALAARELARTDARHLALIGTGRCAMAQLTFMAALYPFDLIQCYSRNPATLHDFCRRASAELGGIEVRPAGSVSAAVEQADIVTTLTTSPVPVLEGAWLPAGVHINAMGQHAPTTRELDTAAVVGSLVVVDSMAQAMSGKGEILIPIDEGAITPEHVHAELGAVVAGRARGRAERTQRTLFCAGGTAFEAMGLCRMLLDKAVAAGIGLPLPGH